MKKRNNSKFKKGFTLIELMIVIVILGVLMGTILPRLTGAQARARDTGRIADLNTIAQALETYFDDEGKYPGTAGIAECLESTLTTHDAIADYLKGSKVPKPPTGSQTTTVAAKTCTGSYLYMPLKNRGLANNGYAIFSDIETYQNANFDASTLTSISNATTVKFVSDLINEDNTVMGTADAIATNTIYAVVN